MSAPRPFPPARLFLLLLLASFGLKASSQTHDLYLYGTVKDYNTAQKLDSTTITLFKDGTVHSTVVTDSSGKYEFKLEYGYECKLLFAKPGMVGKSVVIDPRGVPDEEQIAGLAMNVEMTLFKYREGIDYAILQQPIGRSKYDPVTNRLTWDLGYTEQIRAGLNRLMKEYNEKK